MIIQIKDDNGKVVIEREIKREEVTLKISVKDKGTAENRKEYSIEQVFGSYH